MKLERPDRVNISTLRHILISPRRYLHALANPPADTEALLLGRLIHCFAYESAAVPQRYVVSPRFNAACNDDTAIAKGYAGGKQAKAEWEASVGTREVVTAEMYARAEAVNAALKRDSTCAPFLIGGLSEHAIEWTDPITGIECRGRLDHYNDEQVSDLKSCRSLDSFERDAARLLYHAKITWYHDGAILAGLPVSVAPSFVAVESFAPHDCAVFDLDEAAMTAGRKLYRRALDTLARCRETGSWPGYVESGRRTLTLPAWAESSDDEEEITVGGESIF